MMKNSTSTIFVIVTFFIAGILTSIIVDPDYTPVGVILLLWGVFWFAPVGIFRLVVDCRSNSRHQTIVNAATSYLKENNLKFIQDKSFTLETSHSSILAMVVSDQSGKEFLTIWDGINNMRYVIHKGSITNYRIDVNGEQVSALGGSFLGFGMVRGHVEAVSSVDAIIFLTNGNYMDICIGKNIVKNEFDETNDFIKRLEAMLALYV